MKKLQIFLLALIFIGLGLLFTQRYWVPRLVDYVLSQEETAAGEPRDNTPEQGNIEINFDEIGRLVKDNPGMKPDAWFLIYEEPGAPALSAELIFDDDSVCAVSGQRGKCPDVLLLSSALLRVRGISRDGTVRVITAGN